VIPEPSETLTHELAAACAERDAYLQQRDIALGERNEFLRQRDELVIERDRLLAERPGLTSIAEPDRSPQNSIFITTLPKSGTEFLRGAILDCSDLRTPLSDPAFMSASLSGYSNSPDGPSTGVFMSERLNRDGLRKFAPNGRLFMAHCSATHHNVCTLRDSGFRKVTVLVRDPRDATVSWTHHIRSVSPAMRDFTS
jgi:hypothetical protein